MKIYNIYHIYYLANCPANVFSRLLESQKYETVQFYFAVPTIVETAMDELPLLVIHIFIIRANLIFSYICVKYFKLTVPSKCTILFLRLFSSRCFILKSTQCKEAEESSIFCVT